MDTIVASLFGVICVLLTLVVLLQKGRGGGLGGAFGGAGSSAFGTRTGDVFTWVTVVLTALYILLAVGTSVAFKPPPETVSMPSLKPESRAISSPINVTIDCFTNGAEIYYTVDGSEPTRSSNKYRKNPITIDPPPPGRPVTLKARAFRHGWHDSQTAVGIYSAVEEPATTTSTAPASGPAGDATQPGTVPASRP